MQGKESSGHFETKLTCPNNQTVLTLIKREQEQMKQRNRIKLEQQRKHNKLLQLKRKCRCAYGICQGLIDFE